MAQGNASIGLIAAAMTVVSEHMHSMSLEVKRISQLAWGEMATAVRIAHMNAFRVWIDIGHDIRELYEANIGLTVIQRWRLKQAKLKYELADARNKRHWDWTGSLAYTRVRYERDSRRSATVARMAGRG